MDSGAAQRPVTTGNQLRFMVLTFYLFKVKQGRAKQNKTKQQSPSPTKNLARREDNTIIMIFNFVPSVGITQVAFSPRLLHYR